MAEENRIGPTKNTVGAGFPFEDRVVAFFLIHLLLERRSNVKSLVDERLVEIRVQTEPDGWKLDDLLLKYDCPDGDKLVIGEIKSFPLLSNSTKRKRVIADAWEDFLSSDRKPRPFVQGHDAIALISPGNQSQDFVHVDELVRKARDQDTDFFDRVQIPGQLQDADKWISRLNCPDNISSSQSISVSMRQQFIASLILLQFDFDSTSSFSESTAVESCRCATVSEADEDGIALWQILQQIAQDLRRAGGRINRKLLIEKLPSRLQLKQVPRLSECWSLLSVETQRDLESQRSSIGHRVSLPRQEVIDLATAHAMSGSFALLGTSGCGKSTVAALLARRLKREGTVLWITPQRALDISSRGGRVLSNRSHTIEELAKSVASPSSWVIIDGIDQLTSEEQWEAIARLLIDVCESKTGWRVIVTSQDEQWLRVRSTLSERGVDVRDWKTQSVGLLNQQELIAVRNAFAEIRLLLANPYLHGIIERPRHLDLVVRSIDDGMNPPDDLVGETHFIQWFWERRVIQRYGYDVSSGLQALAKLQADEFELETFYADLAKFCAHPEKLTNTEFLRDRTGRFSFEHDSIADWARLQWLTSKNDLAREVRIRCDNPRWYRALRLLACQILERSESADDWRSLINDCEEFCDFALDGLVFAANSGDLFERTAGELFANQGDLIRGLLRRALVICTIPNQHLLDQISQKRKSPSPYARTVYRDPTPFVYFWHNLFQFLSKHTMKVYETVPEESANVAKLWLEMTCRGWPDRKEASSLAVALAEKLHSERLVHRSYDLGKVAKRIYLSALVAFPENRERCRNLFLEACSRRIPAVLESGNSGIVLPGDTLRPDPFGARDELVQPEPWPHGPHFEVDVAFREACLEGDAIDVLFEFDPELAKEIMLALLIEVRNSRRSSGYVTEFGSIPNCDFGLISPASGLTIPHFRTGPFMRFLIYSPEHAIDFTLKLVNFASELGDFDHASPHDDPVATLPCPFKTGKSLLGGENAVYWNRGLMNACERAIAPLVALEWWLGQHLERGDSVEPYIQQIIAGSQSTAFLGILADVGRKYPELFDRILRPLLASPVLLVWDSTHQNRPQLPLVGQLELNLGEEFFEEHKAWVSASYRKERLIDRASRFVAPSELSWEQLKPYLNQDADGVKEEARFHTLRVIANCRNRDWMGHLDHHFQMVDEPSDPIALDQKTPNTAFTVLDEAAIRIIEFRQALVFDRTLKPEFVEQAVRDNSLSSKVADIEETATQTIVRTAIIAECTFLLLKHADELRSLGAYEPYIGHLIAETSDTNLYKNILKSRPEVNIDLRGALDFDFPYWLVSLAFEVWFSNLDDKTTLRWIAHLACFSTGEAKSQIISHSFANRARLGNWHLRLIHLLHRWSAGWWEISSRYGSLQPNESFDFDLWWNRLCDEFISGEMLAVIPQLPDLFLRDRPLFLAHWRRESSRGGESYFKPPPLDLHNVLHAIVRGTPSIENVSSRQEKREVVSIVRRVVDCHLLILEKYDQGGTLLTSQTVEYPSMTGDQFLLERIAAELRGGSDPEQTREIWEPVVGLGVAAPHHVDYLISKWLWPCLTAEEIPKNLDQTWRAVVRFASSHASWNDAQAETETSELWAHLFCIDNSGYSFWRPEHAALAESIEEWIVPRLARILSAQRCTSSVLRWMSQGFGQNCQILALNWLSEIVEALVRTGSPEDQMSISISEFLNHLWEQMRDDLLRQPATSAAYRKTLRTTAKTGNTLALDLEQRVGGMV